MGISTMTCHDCQRRLAAYIRHELPADERRSVAAHLDGCTACYSVYLQQQSVAQELEFGLPRYGQPARPALDRVWAAVQAEMRRPSPPVLPTLWTSVAMAAIVLLLFVPMVLGGRGHGMTVSAASTQPAPAIQRATPVQITPLGGTPTMVAFYVTPAPNLQTTGPAPDVFNTP